MVPHFLGVPLEASVILLTASIAASLSSFWTSSSGERDEALEPPLLDPLCHPPLCSVRTIVGGFTPPRSSGPISEAIVGLEGGISVSSGGGTEYPLFGICTCCSSIASTRV